MRNGMLEGDCIVIHDEHFNGMITGTVTINSGVKFVNRGMINKNVIVEKNGVFHNYGIVNGDVIGEGHAEIWGMVNGSVSSVSSYIHKEAVVNGKQYKQDVKKG